MIKVERDSQVKPIFKTVMVSQIDQVDQGNVQQDPKAFINRNTRASLGSLFQFLMHYVLQSPNHFHKGLLIWEDSERKQYSRCILTSAK